MEKGFSESQKSSSMATSSSNNIYDIICYYNESDDEPQHVQDVIKKIEKEAQRKKNDSWIKWKLFGCLLINVLLSAPIYSYGTIYLHQKEAFDAQPALIWPPIIYNSVYLLVTPWLFNTISTPVSRNSRSANESSSRFAKLTNKNVIIVFTLVLSVGVSMAGISFSYLNANFTIILIFYSIIGGLSSCIIMGKLFVLINGILNNDRLHMINFIYSFGQALTQFFFPFFIQILTRWICYNCTLLVIGATILHIVPLTLLIVKDKISILLRQKKLRKNKFVDESRYSDTSAVSFDFEVEIKYPSDVFDMDNKWKNPIDFGNDDEESGNDVKCDKFLENLDKHRIMNESGVEILQTILEGDEESDVKHPNRFEENQLNIDTIESIYEEINRKHKYKQRERPRARNCSILESIFRKKINNAITTVFRQIVNPLRRSFKIYKFYPSVILKSCDIFSYLLFITLILPNLALKQYRFEDRGRVIYLIALMGFCWIAYALLVLRFHNHLKQKFINYFHIAGLLGKFFGYLFTNQRYSFNGFIFGLTLISLGHANSFHLQEIMIRNCFHPRKWFYVRGSIYSFSGFLILVYCLIFHVLYVNLTFVTFCNIFVLFNLSGILVWLLTHYKSIIYIFSQY